VVEEDEVKILEQVVKAVLVVVQTVTITIAKVVVLLNLLNLETQVLMDLVMMDELHLQLLDVVVQVVVQVVWELHLETMQVKVV
jgi:hypothetical protein